MPNKHRTALLGWHPSSPEDVARVRAEAEARGVDLKVVLDEMLGGYVAGLEGGYHQPSVVTTSPAPVPVAGDAPPPPEGKACRHRNMRMAKGICPDCHQPVGYK